MITTLRISQVYVLDQQEALDFYVGTLGLAVGDDQDLGYMRWLTVTTPDGRQILLERPGPPSMDERTAEQVRDMLTKGAAGGHLFFTCDDAQRTYEQLVQRGVDITDEPATRPYGVDFGLRDPFGNHIRVAELADTPWWQE
ncbi:VOC family protein [Georgenia sp. TF02-10]|uniref:VOC family protein n=1 Tax=Georgenia sp. TF02-10 TaxID=2917725 RepID=UPI001FA74295|nr:VOC family protein [Georgenia sp. TF02-10]UNX54810.1 VOC family protein [Georgenia sp. TF02-10]